MAESIDKTICGIDVGTNKISALIGLNHAPGSVEIVGIGSNPCRGVQGGVVVNIEATVNSIREAVHQAELMAQTEVTKAFVSMAAPHVSSANSHGSVALQRREVGQEELDRALEAARAIPIDGNHMLHVLSQGYVVDHQGGIRDPRGMSGARLESKVHVVTCSANAVANLATCMQRCEVDIEQIVFEPLASAYAVLTSDEMELGVCLVDIGGGTTDVVAYVDGSVRHTKVFPMAGDELTKNIAKSLRTPIKSAEYLKVMYACAHHDLIPNENSSINVPGVGERPDRTLTRATLTDIVGTWYRNLFEQIREEILDAGMRATDFASGFVFTGGAAKVEGACRLAEDVFEVPAALGRPINVQGLDEIMRSPAYAAGAGLLVFGSENARTAAPTSSEQTKRNGWFSRFRKST